MFILMPPVQHALASAADSLDRSSCATRFARCCRVVGVIVGHNLGTRTIGRSGDAASSGKLS